MNENIAGLEREDKRVYDLNDSLKVSRKYLFPQAS